MSPIITGLQIVGDSEIEISFEYGLQGWLNIADVVNFQDKFHNLKDPVYFATVKVDNSKGIIAWKNGECIETMVLFNIVFENVSKLFPHKEKFLQPIQNSLLYKIVNIENFIDMCTHQYLWFNNVTTYEDDTHDSDMPVLERDLRKGLLFENHPQRNLYDEFDVITRKNTYACCFSLNESRYLWSRYAKDREKSLCLVFNISRLENYFREKFIKSYFLNNDRNKPTDFFINSGLIEYSDFSKRLTKDNHKGIYDYTFHKRTKYTREQEFRISLNPDLRFQFEKLDFLKLSCDWAYLLTSGALININSYYGLTLRRLKRKIGA